MSVNTRLAAQAVAPASPARPSSTGETAVASGELGFEDLIDAINPLQQVPVVSAVYRGVTGDSISIPARLAGGFLYGGPAGLLGSAAMVVFEGITGGSLIDDIGRLFGESGEGAVASNATAAPQLPWLKGTGSDGDAATLPSMPALAEALRRRTAATATAAQTSTAAMATPPAASPDAGTLAKLYALEATANAGRPGGGKSAI